MQVLVDIYLLKKSKRELPKGEKPALRFRVPDGEAVEFTDLAKGPQRFLNG